jgi:hypothetical protein
MQIKLIAITTDSTAVQSGTLVLEFQKKPTILQPVNHIPQLVPTRRASNNISA